MAIRTSNPKRSRQVERMFLRVHRLENVHRVVFESYYGHNVVPVVGFRLAECGLRAVAGTRDGRVNASLN
jgi:hypothetical protein